MYDLHLGTGFCTSPPPTDDPQRVATVLDEEGVLLHVKPSVQKQGTPGLGVFAARDLPKPSKTSDVNKGLLAFGGYLKENRALQQYEKE